MTTLRVTMRGDREVLRALRALPRDADRIVRDGAEDIARVLADRVQDAAAPNRQAMRAARTVRVVRDRFPTITAGPHELLAGSEFGATRKFGWYRRGRYYDSPAKQFRPHLGSGSYWFFVTEERERPWVLSEHRKMLDAIERSWSA